MSFNTKKIILIFLFLLYLSSSTPVLGDPGNNQVALQPQHQNDTSKCYQKISDSYTDIDPIYISSNNSFTPQGFNGSGTDTDPYILENCRITNNSEPNLIWIKNSNAYFIIRNNYIDGINKSPTGIYLSNVTNGVVEKNTIINTSQGIQSAWNSNNNVITDNTIEDNQYGIKASDSFNSTYSYNKIFNNSQGITVDGSNNLVMSNSVVDNLWGAITIGTGENNTIYNNSIMDNGKGKQDSGVYLSSSSSNVTSNIIQNNWEGIGLEGNTNNVSKNIIVQNNRTFSHLIMGVNHSITENIIYSTDSIGIDLSYPSGVIVKWNDFIGNELEQDSQAVTTSDNSFTENYWDDWTYPDADTDGIVDNPYPIPGSGLGEEYFDESPLTSPHNEIPTNLHLLSRPRIIFPKSEDRVSGNIKVQWCSVTDFSGHSVSYTLYYIKFLWEWIEIASGLTETEFEWITANLERYSSYQLRVVAECSEGLTSEHSLHNGFHFEKPESAHGWSFTMLTLTLCLLVFALRRKRSK